MTNAAKTLRAAKALTDTPAKWTQHEFARNKDDIFVSALDPDACCFCINGAIIRASRNVRSDTLKALLRKALSKPWETITKFNDHPDTTHTDVMAFFDRAIALAEAEDVMAYFDRDIALAEAEGV